MDNNHNRLPGSLRDGQSFRFQSLFVLQVCIKAVLQEQKRPPLPQRVSFSFPRFESIRIPTRVSTLSGHLKDQNILHEV